MRGVRRPLVGAQPTGAARAHLLPGGLQTVGLLARRPARADLATGPRPRWPLHSDKPGDVPGRKRCPAAERPVAEVPPYGT
jgi:hypothetical protein